MRKIPEGTQFIEAGCGDKGFRKFEKGCWWFYEGFWRNVDWRMGALTLVSEHPGYTAPATPWTGEGLPPVGTVCEVKGCMSHYLKWNKVTVFAVRGKTVMFDMEDGRWGQTDQHEFRPIRTPEQIAAE